MVGISAGYHRYFTHRSFTTTPFIECVMLFLGLICGGRSPLSWAGVHRMHHATSDTHDDPHSPIFKGAFDVLFSRWHVDHIPRKYIIDLIRNPRVVFFHKYGKAVHLAYALAVLLLSFNLFVILVVFPYVVSWIGFGVLNWAAHKDGEPCDVPIVNLLAPGEGWHKYHHDNPSKYKLNKYDITGWLIERFFITTKPCSKDTGSS
jgi:stearoyl-CoA desaturase (delta-9 desaturase)